jgi:hypothetical protein
MRRNKQKCMGRPKVEKPKRFNYNERLGGVPMVIKKGKIDYVWSRPAFCWNHKDIEEIEREEAEMPTGEGDFVRRHIYEVRFDIKDETDDERRKREYKEWWEEKRKV